MMDKSLRIAIGEDTEDHVELLRRVLQNLGHEVISVADTGTQLIEDCQQQQPDLVITDIQMPDMDGLEAASQIYDDSPLPIIVITSHLDPEYVERAEQGKILGFLVKPVTEKELVPAIAIVMRRFSEFEALKEENVSLQQALEDRKLIERAKGILMKQASLDEEEAFTRLRKLARDKRKKLAEIAAAIVTASEAMG